MKNLKKKLIEIAMLKKIIVCASVLFLASCSSKFVRVYHVNEKSEVATKRGVYYALPKTMLKVEVTVNQLHYVRGPFAEYADKYLNIPDVIQTNKITNEISNIDMQTTVVPDPDNYYFVQMPKCCNSRALNLQVTEQGIIAGYNQNVIVENKQKPVKDYHNYTESEIEAFAKTFLTSNLKVDVDTIVERVMVDSIMVEKKRYSKLTSQKSNEEKAREASETIFKLRNYKTSLISGELETAYEKSTLRMMIEELEKREQEYLQLFTGASMVIPIKYTFYFSPDERAVNDMAILFRFNKDKGILPAEGTEGDTVSMTIQRSTKSIILKSYIEAQMKQTSKRHGLFYRIPETATFTIKQGNVVKAEKSLVIAQFGAVLCMPKSKVSDVYKFVPEQGSISDFILK